MHKAGFVNIVGYPNVGKSTLMNALLGERMSVINRKPQTTRHRILGILNENDFQIVFSDTPGMVTDPKYALHDVMNTAIVQVFEDADVILYLTTLAEYQEALLEPWQAMFRAEAPVFAVINKCDLGSPAEVDEAIRFFSKNDRWANVFAISALHGAGVDTLLDAIINALPEHPPFYPKDQLSDKPERFFVAEIIRDKILTLFHQEIPYSCEVVVDRFKRETDSKGPIVHISADIHVNRKSQKSILIGKGGEAIKRLGTRARKDIERFLDSRVYLELYVRVRENWRDDKRSLKHFGY